MAYVQDEEQQGTPGAGGQVLAGSGGAKTGTGQVAGTGFTNLQKYLDANKGQGAGIAGDIVGQGQQAVDAERAKADASATAWGDTGVQQANDAATNASSVYDTTANALKADPNYRYSGDVWGTTYGGPQEAQKVDGYNDLDKAYQNVKNTATSFANDRMTQQAGLQNKYGYGSGFAALDTFLGRQDGKDQIQGWAAGVNPGSAQGQIDRVNNAITGGKQQVATAQSGFEQANRDAKAARTAADRQAQGRVNSPSAPITGGRGLADAVVDDNDLRSKDKSTKPSGGGSGRTTQR